MVILMNTKNLVSRRLNLVVASLAAATAMLLSGCGIGPLAPASDPISSGATISGVVHGGQFPVYNSVVRLYSAGTSGYGEGSTLLATSINTNTSGGFSFTKLGTTGGVLNSP